MKTCKETSKELTEYISNLEVKNLTDENRKEISRLRTECLHSLRQVGYSNMKVWSYENAVIHLALAKSDLVYNEYAENQIKHCTEQIEEYKKNVQT